MITAEHITVRYDRKVALDDVSFHVNRGDYLAIVGENGSGKSTLIKALLGLKKIDSGRLSMDSALRIGYLPQLDESMASFPAKVKDIVRMGLLNRMGVRFFYRPSEKREADRAMEKVDMAVLAEKPFSELSGGQKQRVLLARALVSSREILFLDEPTTGLDPMATAELYDILDALNRDGLTILMVTHDVKTAIACAGKILHLSGKTVFFGDKTAYMQTDEFRNLSGVHHHDTDLH